MTGNVIALTEPRAMPALARNAENVLAAAALLAMAVLPVLEMVLRTLFGLAIPGSISYVHNLTLWVAFLGAMIATRERRHLSLSTGMASLPPWAGRIAANGTTCVSVAVSCGLFWAGLQFVLAESASDARIAGWLPVWPVIAVLPASFAVIAVRLVAQSRDWSEGVSAMLGGAAAVIIGFVLAPYAELILWPGIIVLIAAALAGAPIFVVLGGAALLLFFADGSPVAAVPVETYRIVMSPALPAIPLFTLTGYLLADGGASRRLVRLFRALLGWMPGGMAIVATLVCAMFTTFTGASGVTIVALGGLLLTALVGSGFPDRFSVGLLTATGSIGLLFPPSLAVILYAVVAHVPIPDLFMAALVPGLIMVGAICVMGVREGMRVKTQRPRFDSCEAAAALWDAKWEVLLPVVVIAALFGGVGTLLEVSAITVVYTLIVEVVVHRDLDATRDLPGIVIKCVTLIGGVLTILGIAMGLTSYMVDAEIPMTVTAWVRSHIESPIVFLLALNVFLLIVGSVMEIFSAIAVVVPLILPIGLAFGINPLHLGVIFLVNLELGYLTPPVGMNLFLAGYRFNRPLAEVYRSALPFLLVLLVVVLLVTYIPALTVGVAGAG